MTRAFRLIATTGLACTVSITAAESASALSCLGPSVTLPQPESVVPTNTRIWCSSSHLDSAKEAAPKIVLTDASDIEIEGTQTRLVTDRFELHIFQPDTELSPDSDYRVQCTEGFRYDVARTFAFRTGAGPRLERPPLPDVSKLSLQAPQNSGWGVSDYAIFDEVSQPGLIVVIDFDGTAELDRANMSGSLSHAEVLASDATLYVGDGPCGGSWPEAGTQRSANIAFGVFDVTGAFSGWTDPISVTLPPTMATSPQLEEPSGIDDTALPDSETVEEGATPERSGRDVSLNPVDGSSARSSGCQLRAEEFTSAREASLLLLLLGLTLRRRRALGDAQID